MRFVEKEYKGEANLGSAIEETAEAPEPIALGVVRASSSRRSRSNLEGANKSMVVTTHSTSDNVHRRVPKYNEEELIRPVFGMTLCEEARSAWRRIQSSRRSSERGGSVGGV